MPHPPEYADRLLRLLLTPHRQEEVLGDLHEEFYWQVRQSGERRARRQYWLDVLGFMKPRFLKRRDTEQLPDSTFQLAMIRNYVTIAFRQLWKNQLFSALNIAGLTVGLAVSTFIALYVWHEFHYDRFEPFAGRTYRVISFAKYAGQEVSFPNFHESFGAQVKKQLPDVADVVRISDGFEAILKQKDGPSFKEEGIGFADGPTLTTFGYKVLHGDPATALTTPGRIVLTRQLAEKYFGNTNPVGKTIIYDKHYPLTVSAVLDDLPTNSVIRFKALVSLVSMPSLGAFHQNIYKAAGFLSTYLLLRPDAHVQQVAKKLEKVNKGLNFMDASSKFELEALPNLHLDSRTASKETRQSLYILLTISLVILALAVINYISLTTARATKRAREVGVRKAIGGQRSELITQFFTESFLTTTIAFALSLLLLQLFFPWANNALNLEMDSRVLTQGPYWGLMFGLWLGCSLLAGGYPALLLSNFRPALVLKGATTWRQSGTGVRQIFTTVQFTASIGLLICSLVLYSQMRYLRTHNLGINREQIVALTIDSEMKPQFGGLRDAIRQWAGPENVAVSNTALFTNRVSTWFMETEKTKKQVMLNALTVDRQFFSLLGAKWAYKPVGWDNGAITKELTIFNQTVLKEAGITGNPLQQPAPFKGQHTDGIIADFHISGLQGPVSPVMFSVVSDTNRTILARNAYLMVKLRPHTDVPQAMDQLKAIYDRSNPTAPFDYYFLDDAYNRLYSSEARLMQLFNSFTALTLLVACLGLLGLMTFTIEARTKEIGVRKVLGASVPGIVSLLAKDFLKLVVLSLVIASPVAWYAMDKWLQRFTYKIEMQWWMFAAAGAITLLIAVLTVSFQSIKAALMNPVSSLRSE